MPITINGVTCEVISTGYEEHANPSGQGATRGYLCDWDQRFLVANFLLGLTTYTGTGAGGVANIVDPQRLEDIPGIWVTGVRIEGKGKPFQNAVGLGYPYAIVWADYGNPPYSNGANGEAQIDPDTSFIYATQELDASEEYVSIPGQALAYPTGALSNIDRSIVVTTVDMTITFHKLPYIPMPAMAHAGKVNDAVFLGIPRGQVRFCGVKTSRDYSNVDGQVLQKTAFRFSYRPIADWNKVPSIELPGTWTLLKYKGTSVYPYPYYDLRAVWPGEYVNSA